MGATLHSVCEFLVEAALAAEYKLQRAQASVLVAHGLSCSEACRILSSQTRDRAHVPSFGRWILNHWTTREVPENIYFSSFVEGW